jgi:hypothetical protein
MRAVQHAPQPPTVEVADFYNKIGRDPSSRRGRASEYAVNLGGHDEVVLMQSLDLLGLQRDRRIAPTEADIRMMAFSFREFTNLLNKSKRLPEIAKPEAPLDAVSFLRQLPVWGLCMKELSLLAREWRYSPATWGTGFASKSLGHVACALVSTVARTKAGKPRK